MPEYSDAEIDKVYDLFEWAASIWPSDFSSIPNVTRSSNNDYLIKRGLGFGIGPDTIFDLGRKIVEYELFDEYDSQTQSELKGIFNRVWPTAGDQDYPVNTNAAWSPYHTVTWQRAVQVAIKEVFEVTCNARIAEQFVSDWIASLGDVYESDPADAVIPLNNGVHLESTNDGELVCSGDGNDTIEGFGGDDTLNGRNGDDILSGGADNDVLYGGIGSDKLSGGTGTDILRGEAGNDILEGGVRADLMPDDAATFFNSLTTTLYYDDGEQDILDGGNGHDAYYVYHVEKYITDTTDWESTDSGADPYGFFDAVFIGYDYGATVRQKFNVADFAHVDRIRDSDGSGDIYLQTPDAPDGTSIPPFNSTSGEFTKWTTYGVDLFFDDYQNRTFYYHEGDLYGLTVWAASEWGSGVNADWFGLQANFVIENFENGDFGIDLPLGGVGTSEDDTPDLQPAGGGQGTSYYGGDGQDVLIGTNEADVLRGDAGNDVLEGGQGDDDVAGGSGDDDVAGGDGNDEVNGGAGNDTLSGGGGHDQIYGGDGNDTITGGIGSDALNGQAGQDVLQGGGGADNYFFAIGGGEDVIRESGLSSENDTLFLVGVSADDVALRMTGANYKDLLVTLLSTGESIIVEDQFLENGSSDSSIERIDISGTRENDYQDDAFLTENQIRDIALAATNGNAPPDLVNAIADQSAAEDTAWSFVVPANTFADLDGDQLTYRAALADGSSLPSWLSFDESARTFTGTPPQDFNGTVAIKVVASDGASLQQDVFDLVVAPVNDAPVVSRQIDDQSIAEDSSWNFTVPGSTISDADGDQLFWNATLSDGSALPSWLSFDDASQTFSGTPPQDFNGSLSLKVLASDGLLSVESIFNLVVTPVNDIPLVAQALSDQTHSGDTEWIFTVPAQTFSDVEGDQLVYSASLADGSAMPDWLEFDGVTRTFSGTSPQDFQGTLSLMVLAADYMFSTAVLFDLVVNSENSAPQLSVPIEDQSSSEDLAWSYTVAADAFADADGDALVYSATLSDGSALPSWLSFDIDTRTFSGIPPQDFNGMLTLKVVASDGNGTAEDLFDLVIDPVNDAPVVANSVSEQSASEDTAWSFTVPGDTFNDVDGDSLTYSATLSGGSALPSWLSFDAATRSFTGTPPAGTAGILGLLVIVSDGALSAQAAFDLAIEASGPTSGNDTLTGTAGDDTIDGLAGDDVINGLAGNDTLTGGSGADSISGGEGDDIVYADANDTWFGGDAGRDTLIYTGTNDFQYASAQGSFEIIKAGSGNNSLWGDAADNEFDGEAGDDLIQGGDGDDILRGGSGADTLQGQDGNDTIYADADDTWFSGDAGIDTLVYQGTDDFEYALGQGAFEKIYAGSGNNKVWGTDGDNEIYLDAGNDFVQAGDGNDIIDGGTGSDSLQGQGGDDTIYADADDSWFSGDSGIDTLVYTSSDDRHYSLAQGSFENAYMGSGNNIVWGTSAGNTIDSEAGADTLYGYDGVDRLIGGSGADTLYGGGDSDTFAFKSGQTGHDTVGDFTAGASSDDVIEFETSIFSSFAAVVAAATDDGTDTTITIDAETSITLQGVIVSGLHQDDFSFV